MKPLGCAIFWICTASVAAVFLDRESHNRELSSHDEADLHRLVVSFQAERECSCRFEDVCSCQSALQFMRCIQATCASSGCYCTEGQHFLDACNKMAATCGSIGLECHPEKAVCGQTMVTHNGTLTSQPLEPSLAWQQKLDETRHVGHQIFGFLMLTSFISLLAMFALAQNQNKTLINHAYGVFDSTNGTLIGMMLFSIVNTIFLGFEKPAESDVQHGTGDASAMRVAVHVLFAMSMFFFALFYSYRLKDFPLDLTVFNSVIFWCVLLAKGGALSAAQDEYAGHDATRALMISAGALACLVILMIVSRAVKPARYWYNDQENKLFGGVACIVVSELFNLLMNSFFVMEYGETAKVPGKKMLCSNIFAVLALLLSVFATQPLIGAQKKYEYAKTDESKHIQHLTYRILSILVTFCGTLPMFAVNTGITLFISNYFELPESGYLAKTINVMIKTVFGVMCILTGAFVPYFRRDTEHAKQLAGFVENLGGFQIGDSWSNMITAGVSASLSAYKFSGYKLSVAEAVVCSFLLAVQVPVYMKYIKPLIIRVQDECAKGKG